MILLEDTLMGKTHDLRISPYYSNVEAGTTRARFSIRFTENTSLSNNLISYTNELFSINYLQNTKQISIIHPKEQHLLDNLKIYNILGQPIATYDIDGIGKNDNRNTILNTSSLKSGIYIISLNTEMGNLNKKIVVNK